eukprot:1841439-Prymnesium_polylepis.2
MSDIASPRVQKGRNGRGEMMRLRRKSDGGERGGVHRRSARVWVVRTRARAAAAAARTAIAQVELIGTHGERRSVPAGAGGTELRACGARLERGVVVGVEEEGRRDARRRRVAHLPLAARRERGERCGRLGNEGLGRGIGLRAGVAM